MARIHPTSVLMPGVLEEINISDIKTSTLLRSIPELDNNNNDSDIHELSRSIIQNGLLQPIVVRDKDKFYEIVAGNRRYHACKLLGRRKIVCHVVELDDKSAFEVSLVENVQRKTLSPIEEARAFKGYVSDFGYGGISELAAKIGKSASYVTRRIKLLDLPLEVLDFINSSNMDVSTAGELLYVKDKTKQSRLAQLISERRLSMRKVREILKDRDEGCLYSGTIHERKEDYEFERIQRSFNKAITTLRIAMNRFGTIVENMDENWMIHEALMYHKNLLHMQIDLLLKEKRKI